MARKRTGESPAVPLVTANDGTLTPMETVPEAKLTPTETKRSAEIPLTTAADGTLTPLEATPPEKHTTTDTKKPAEARPVDDDAAEESDDDDLEVGGKRPVEVGSLEELRETIQDISPDTEAFMNSGNFLSGNESGTEPDIDMTPYAIPETPKEWREKLRELIEGAKGKVETAGERAGDLKEYLKNRTIELDAALAAKAEKLAKEIGEKYNKLPLWAKITTGGVLTLGLAGTMGVAWPLTSVFGGLIAAQRAAGMLGMFTKFEKHLQETNTGVATGYFANREWYKKLAEGSGEDRKNKAAIMAMGYTFGLSAIIGKTAQELSETEWTKQTQEWLRNNWPFGETKIEARSTVVTETTAPKLVSPPVAEAPQPAAALKVEVPQPAAAAADISQKIDAALAEAQIQVPEVSVEATQGKGYEYMAKRLWEQLQEKGLDSSNYAEGSDIRRLLEADASSIDKVVHQIAADPQHGFFNPDGTSVRIDVDAHMTFDADGQLRLSDSINAVQAPLEAPVTPAYHPEAPTSQAPAPTIEHSFVSNQFGLNIPIAEPHIYAGAGAGSIFAFGGTVAEQASAIKGYLTRNPDAVVIGTDESGTRRIPWYRVRGKVTAGPVMKEKTGFLGLSSREMKSPQSEELAKIIT